ncbi:hypothetical protein [Streptomyces ardesiacus]|uniref:hypothetical protein n=1 Tax=Streptomyces ardesiacus TaxID=285564 RepID=UPI00201EE72B|nr:hypothetical protein [Streptomyces ardesiacus]MCL7366836.1 hypothetical protein [Streptomyces ardesiacus]
MTRARDRGRGSGSGTASGASRTPSPALGVAARSTLVGEDAPASPPASPTSTACPRASRAPAAEVTARPRTAGPARYEEAGVFSG